MGECFLYRRGAARSGGSGGGAVGTEMTAIGSVISLTNSLEKPLKGLRIFGRTTQAGTPTPDAPVALVSPGDAGYLRTHIIPAFKTVEGDTHCGIQVASGGNYIDSDGQRWICDEVDLIRGVRVQRILKAVWNGSETIQVGSASAGGKRFAINQYRSVIKPAAKDTVAANILCSHFPVCTAEDTYFNKTGISVDTSGRIYFYYPDIDQTADAMKAFFASNPVTFLAELATPIETSLTASELAAYAERYGQNAVAFGVTMQNGTPTPGAPVALENRTDVVQTMLTSTPNGLPGIPVASGGNYTDTSGLQWVCDYVDCETAEHVQRAQLYSFTGDENVSAPYWDATGFYYNIGSYGYPAPINGSELVTTPCSHTTGRGALVQGTLFFRNIGSFANQAEAKTWLKAQHDAGTPFTVLYQLATPIRTPLSAEAMAAYAALHTYAPTTTIYNDGGAEMEVKYMSIGG